MKDEVKYLGYTLQSNGGQEAQVRDKMKRTASIMGVGTRDWKQEIWKGLRKKVVDI